MVPFKELFTIWIRWKINLLLIIIIVSSNLNAESVLLSELVNRAGSELRWNPYRERGLIMGENTVISFKVGSSFIIRNSDELYSGVNIYNSSGNILVSEESAKLIYRLLNFDQEHEELVNDEELYNIPVIILDPGHGGRDPGALGNFSEFSVKEKDVVLDIGKRVANKLKERYSHKRVLLTRSSDKFLTLEERVELANAVELKPKEAVIYISIHANASVNRKAQGFEVWYLPKNYRRNVLKENVHVDDSINAIVNAVKEDEISLEGVELASTLSEYINNEIGEYSSNRGLKEEIWYVVRKARMASVLIEVGFVTNEIEGKRLTEDEYLQKIADGIYNGITKFVTMYED